MDDAVWWLDIVVETPVGIKSPSTSIELVIKNCSLATTRSGLKSLIGHWDVSNVTTMYGMFWGAASFNQDLSDWCVNDISTEPANFSAGASAWTLPKPVWGICP